MCSQFKPTLICDGRQYMVWRSLYLGIFIIYVLPFKQCRHIVLTACVCGMPFFFFKKTFLVVMGMHILYNKLDWTSNRKVVFLFWPVSLILIYCMQHMACGDDCCLQLVKLCPLLYIRLFKQLDLLYGSNIFNANCTSPSLSNQIMTERGAFYYTTIHF